MNRRSILFTLLMLLLSISASVQAQYSRQIKGQVLDANTKEELIGVSVVVKNTTNGVATDIDGKFTLNLQDSDHKTLEISYIGYEPKEVILEDSDTDITIMLEERSMMLSEVVIIGYGTQMRRSMTGAVQSVVQGTIVRDAKNREKGTTWKRSGMRDNSIRLEVGKDDFLPLEAAQMSVQVDGFRVRVLLDCFFYNNKGDGLEGMFKLKLPTEATPYYMAFGETSYLDEDEEDKKREKQIPFQRIEFDNFNMGYQNIIDKDSQYWNRVKEARIVSKQKAARAYEQTVGAKVDPAIMEWGGADMFSCKVFPLSNNTLHRVVIGYDLNMVEALDFREYILSFPKVEKELRVELVTHNTSTMPVAIKPAQEVTEQSESRTYYSLTNPKEKELKIHYNTVEPVLLVQADDPDDYDLKEELNIPYFAANYRVSLPEVAQENLPKDAVFVLDASISSNPDKFNVWLKLIDEVLDKNRDIIKRFAVLSFNIDEKWYAPYFQKNNYYNKERFLEYANTLALEGATDLGLALQEASKPSWLKKGAINTPKHIFLMSDGDCNWGETNMHKFTSLINAGDRVHTYRTGLSGTNTGVLNYLSKTTNGFAFTVTGEEEAVLTAKSFRYKPWTIEGVKVEGVEDFLISGQPTQLYNGQKLIFTGRQIPEGSIAITVNNGIETKEIVYTAKERIESPLVSRIYGQIASSYLENYGFKAEEAAVNYSTYYRMPGAYTSLLMLESEWDYDNFGIDEYDAKGFVEDNLVADLIEEYEKMGAIVIAGEAKEDFIAWLQRLDEGDISLEQSDELEEYLASIPKENFIVNLKSRKYNVHLAEQQTEDELELLADEDVRFDRLLKLARKRIKTKGYPDALRLLSSAVERNASDMEATRDIALTALDWDMPEHAYYMMKRLIEWREGDSLAYLTAAEALAAMRNNVDLALLYYYICIDAGWDDEYGNITDVAAIKCRQYIKKLKEYPNENITEEAKIFMAYLNELAEEKLLSGNFENSDEADLLIVVSWNTPSTDIDLHIIEPSGEECYFGHSMTEIGGQLSSDVTNGYGPEMYLLREAVPGTYKVVLDYYSDSGRQSASKPKSYIQVFRNWGRPNEKRSVKTIELSRYNDYYESDEDEEKNKIAFEFTIPEEIIKNK